ncbi:hypothetical protein B0H11DRAFT_2219018 [Mycena galericulata]|nr:hypothetical protein B0H11DRAFT_2219018 [Mycena galericulata]
MLDEFRAADEDQLLVLEEEFRDLALKEAQILEQLTQVRSAKQRVRRMVAEKKNRYAPIFTLPDELLVYIVERFRWAVLGAPTLWSSIELRWGGECDEERFAAYLQRSQVCALSVRLVYSSYHGKSECDYEEVPNELATVVQHISRIRRLVLECGGMGLAFDDTMAHFSQLKAPCLESVDISCVSVLDSWGEDGPWPYPSIFNNGAPRLTTLKLTNAYPDLRGMQGASTAYSSVLRSLLAGCPQLVDLTLDGSTYVTSADDFHPAESISMPSLRTLKGLRLDSNEPDALLLGALHFFHAPAIEVLQFSGVHGPQISTFFNGVAASKFPALRSLRACSDARSKSMDLPNLPY